LTGNQEQAINWAMRQPWIDVITNSYGVSTTLVARDRVYNACNLGLQKTAVNRGQNVLFSSGNGVENAFVIPNSTLFSCQEGPDWIMTVSAINSVDPVYVGTDSISTFTNEPGGADNAGRPADIASIGDSYPSAYEATTTGGSGELGFGGTSNATPVTAGMYARALYDARQQMAGASRIQLGGVISVGAASCGAARPNCEIGDGKLTYVELRDRLYGAARHTVGTSPAGLVTTVDTEDTRNWSEGHGAVLGRIFGADVWASERARITGPLFGTTAAAVKDADEERYARALSFCSQHLWGTWNAGAWTPSKGLPAAAYQNWPTRTTLVKVCPLLKAPPRQPYVALYGDPDA
jgi:hypothetical protein